MEIKRLLNNNAALTVDKMGSEIIVLGKGIAFQKKKGDEISDGKIEKVFQLSDHESFLKFQELMTEIPLEYMELSDQIISLANGQLDKPLNDSIYVSLSDHLYSSIKRFNEGVVIKNVLIWDIRRFYPKEYQISKQALALIKQVLNVQLPEDEAGFIALHFVNAESPEENENSYQVTKIMKEITNIVRRYFQVEFDENSLHYYRFITHLKFFAQRLVNHKLHESKNEEDLLNIVKDRFPNAYLCVKKIDLFVSENYSYQLTQEEILYLTIHIQRVIYKK